jgi:ABC-type multidrug transport system fused ATPase/permease subunit
MFTGWSDVLASRKEYEEESNNNEKYLIDMFNNMEKIIFRGKGQDEINTYSNQSINSTKKNIDFYDKVDNRVLILNIILYITIFILIASIFYLYIHKEIELETFISFFTIILLYRDRMNNNYESLVDYIEFFGKLDYVIESLSEILGEQQVLDNKIYKPIELQFNNVRFENIT